MLKRILSSKIFKISFSLILVFLAFKNVDLKDMLLELSKVPFWFVMFYLFMSFFLTTFGSYRWSLILLKKPSFVDVINFTKSSFYGSFCSLVFPSAMVGDLFKWMPLRTNYPDITQTRLLSSIFIDRVIGFSSFVITAILSLILGVVLKFNFPVYLLWVFTALFFGVSTFFTLIYVFDIEKLISRFSFYKKIEEIFNLFKRENKRRLLFCLFISIIFQICWILPVWLVGLIFNSGISFIHVLIFMPIISLILILPISFAGFGAREHLYLYFFGLVGITSNKILLVSSFNGVAGILSVIIGGLIAMLLISLETKQKRNEGLI